MTLATLPVQREVEHVMGMPLSLAVRGSAAGTSSARDAWRFALDVLHAADRTFSTYREDSWIRRLSRGEVTVDECPSDVAEVLALGEQARVESAGAFDVRRPGPDGRLLLDPSGVVKGWAVQRATGALAELDDTDFCLSLAGDMACRVADPHRSAWRVGIEDPLDPSRVVAVVPLRDGAIATSGLNRRGAHIVDARTGSPATHLASVTVVADELTWADIDATAAFAQGPAGLDWLRTRPGRTGLVVHAGGQTETWQGPPPSR